jgi:SAM-dependent methyltransferase
VNPVVSPGGPVLLVPCVDPGRGGGHLTRCVTLLSNLRRRGRNAFLYLEGEDRLETFRSLIEGSCKRESWGNCRAWLIPGRKEAAEMSWELIVLDRVRTPPEEYAFWCSLGPLLGIDEGGYLREDFNFLLDLLPRLPRLSPPNLMDPSLLPLPSRRRSSGEPLPSGRLRILISFGTEDQARFGPETAKALEALGKEAEITLVDPPAGKYIAELREHLAEYDLLITHFGFTAFEAVYAGLAVLLISPGDYQEKLARGAGFFSVGAGLAGIRAFPGLLMSRGGTLNRDFVEGLRQRCAAIAKRYGLDRVPLLSLDGFIEKLRPRGNFRRDRPCPACGATWNPGNTPPWDETPGGNAMDPGHQVLARFPDRTYRRCSRCGIVYMNRLTEPPVEYAREYFFDFYKKQYGKTYLEDFPHLIALGKRRLKLISSLLDQGDRGTRARLLDIGCAYGPFLQAAAEAGFSPAGIEAAGEAAAYVVRELKFPVIQGLFPLEAEGREGSFPPPFALPGELRSESFSVLSFWYVIEHFPEPRLALKEANRLLKPGGVLAFSTPSFRGVSGRKSPRLFLENSPADHWTVWSPRNCRPLLKRAGFSLKKIVVTGHHPERFPLCGFLFKKRKGPLYGLVFLISRLFRLGDSFEVYAVKD